MFVFAINYSIVKLYGSWLAEQTNSQVFADSVLKITFFGNANCKCFITHAQANCSNITRVTVFPYKGYVPPVFSAGMYVYVLIPTYQHFPTDATTGQKTATLERKTAIWHTTVASWDGRLQRRL